MSFSGDIVVTDIGGTHARFAIARIESGSIAALGDLRKLATADFSSLQMAWDAYQSGLDRKMPKNGAVAIAGTVQGKSLTFTNSSWLFRAEHARAKLGLVRFTLVNDFAAIAHAVATLPEGQFAYVCGEKRDLPEGAAVSIVGPGTGLGVSCLTLKKDGYLVHSTESGHIGFAPFDQVEDKILAYLRRTHRRVSVERIVSGPGLSAVYQALGHIGNSPVQDLNDKEIWKLALSGRDPLASAALDRFCLCFGAFAGDIALAHGAKRVVLAGGITERIGDLLGGSGFSDRFVAKGRLQSEMSETGVYRITHEQPGLYGAAAAFLKEHDTS